MGKRGQGATEMMLVLAIALVVLLVILSYYNKISLSTSGQRESAKAKVLVQDLSNAAKLVYQEGVGSRTKLYLTIPDNVNSINISSNTIKVNLAAGGSTKDVYEVLDFNISGTIPTEVGNLWLCVESMEGYVSVGDCITPSGQINETPAVCENNIKESGEECDTSVLDPYTSDCSTYPGMISGTLACYDNCTYDTSLCIGDTTPPDSITNLLNQSAGTQWILWNWTNPTDADFSKAILYIDGGEVANTSNNYFNVTGLMPDTEYTLTVHTKDLSNNVNNIDVNSTASTISAISGEWELIFYDKFNRPNSYNPGANWTETGGKWDVLDQRGHADDCDYPGDQITSINIDLSTKSNAQLQFDWEYQQLDPGECLSLDLNSGSGWIVEVYENCSSVNNQNLLGSVTINLLDYIPLTSTVQLRFDCFTSHHVEDVYIDNVNVSAIE